MERLKELLLEMLRLDRGDLDFGLYRIMRMKATEIRSFLDRDLFPQVQEVIDGATDEQRAALEKEIANISDSLRKYGAVPDDALAVQNLKAELKRANTDVAAEADVFGHLVNFFARYYAEGDFMPLRRYSSGDAPTYRIPWDGEEVKLHWAHSDQYYVKTTENYASYAFLASAGDASFRARFEIAMADNEKDDIKEANGRQRRFVLARQAVALKDGELVVRFEHRPLRESEKQKWPGNGASQQERINGAAVERIRAAVERLDPERLSALDTPAPTDVKQQRTLLEKHVGRYTAKNSFDYFIHKDLAGFLRRELDLYLKTDVLDLQDLAFGDADRLRRALGRMRGVREIGGKLIDFLAQLENFQKRLWLKKKFVLETEWCVTLDRIPERFYPEIAANEAQHAEWVELFAIDRIVGYAKPLPVGFFKANPFLTLDTRHFDRSFKDRLLAALSEAAPLDEQTDGLLIQGENAQALRLSRKRYAGKIQCIHIDPPYNTQTSGFMYKNGYMHSSWMAMMQERMECCMPLLEERGHFLCHIDENEHGRLHVLMDQFDLPDAGTIVWDKRNPMTAGGGVAIQHEYVLWRTHFSSSIDLHHGNEDLILDNAAALIEKHGMSDLARKEFAKWVRGETRLSNGDKSYAYIDSKGQVYRSVSLRAPEMREDPKFHESLIHPITGKPCPVPPNGFSRTPETLASMMERGEILFGKDETSQPRQKRVLHRDASKQISSVIPDAKRGKSELDELGLGDFPYAHATSLYDILVGAAARKHQDTVLDFFGGSGTTGHAVLNLRLFQIPSGYAT